MSDISKNFEALCDKEFALLRQQACENLDREIAEIKTRMASKGNARSSSMARAVVDAVLARLDKVLLAFEKAYLAKWADTTRGFSDTDETWLKRKITEKLEPEIIEVKSRCNNFLWDSTLTFAGFWQKAGATARERVNIIRERIEILRLQKNQGEPSVPSTDNAPPSTLAAPAPWDFMHPRVARVAKSRFDSGHFADSVEAALKDINDIVRQIVREKTGKDLDGADLMNRAFSPKKPIIVLDDLSTTTGKSIQVGYMQIFAGAMTGIRNPKAHANLDIDPARALHFLFLASLLQFKIDERSE